MCKKKNGERDDERRKKKESRKNAKARIIACKKEKKCSTKRCYLLCPGQCRTHGRGLFIPNTSRLQNLSRAENTA
jgi:hypothetical protein